MVPHSDVSLNSYPSRPVYLNPNSRAGRGSPDDERDAGKRRPKNGDDTESLTEEDFVKKHSDETQRLHGEGPEGTELHNACTHDKNNSLLHNIFCSARNNSYSITCMIFWYRALRSFSSREGRGHFPSPLEQSDWSVGGVLSKRDTQVLCF